jgi:tetratricopeptide (TPR) repeat protein
MIDASANGGTERPWVRTLTLSLFTLLLVGPLAYKHAPREVARWYQAIAAEQFENGEEERARQSIENALRWSPDDSRIYLQVARWRREAGRHDEALEWCGKARERGGAEVAIILEETENLWSLKRWDDALAQWKRLSQLASESASIGSSAVLLNSLAYARALANTELTEALRDIDEAIELAGRDSAFLDTRGYILYRRGEYEAARRDLDAALELIGVPVADSDAQTSAQTSAQTKGQTSAQSKAPVNDSQPAASPPKEKEGKSSRSATAQAEVQKLQRTRAVLLYHRMLILEKLNAEDDAAADRRRIEALGYRPDDSLF